MTGRLTDSGKDGEREMIKRGLSIAVIAMAALFLIAGTAVLLMQHSYLSYYLPDTTPYNYYPLGVIAQLFFTGIPCLVFGVLDLVRRDSEKGNLWLFVTVYCSVILITHNVLGTIFDRVQMTIGARINGAPYVAGFSVVTSAFSQVRIFANAALVFLLILSVLRIAERTADKNA